MAQSADSDLRGTPAFWSNHTIEPPTHWSNWIDQFHLAIIARENINIDNLKDPVESKTDIPFSKGPQDSEVATQRNAREARNKEVMKFMRTLRIKESRRSNKSSEA